MKKLIVLVLAFAVFACAEDRVQKILPVKNGDSMQVFQTVRDVLDGMPITVKLYQNNIVVNGTPEMVAAAEQLVKNLGSSTPHDRDVEITGYIILASVETGEGTAAVPGELEPVLKQFRNVLNYKSFRVLDTIILRTKENSSSPANSDGSLPLPNGPTSGASVHFNVNKTVVAEDTIQLKGLRLGTSVQDNSSQYRNINLSSDVDVKAGQKVAIGKAGVDANGDALILVISAKVVD
jgi:hypothetical protein